MAGTSITLSLVEYDFLWEHLGLGTRPTVLDIDSCGRTLAERNRLRDLTWDTLHAKGLVRHGSVGRWLTHALTTLARPRWAIDFRLEPNRQVTALIATAGPVAVRASMRAQRLTLTRIEPSGMARAAVSLLPRARPGTGASVTLPTDVLNGAAGEATDTVSFQRALITQGVDRDGARKIGEVLAQPVRYGQFGMTHRPPFGPGRSAEYVVTFYDTDSGRYLFTSRPSADGRPWATLVAADTAKIIEQLDELRASIR